MADAPGAPRAWRAIIDLPIDHHTVTAGLILRLGACGGAGLAEIGGKSINLDALLRAGFPVPAGFVVATAAYAAAAERAGLSAFIDRLGPHPETDPQGLRDVTAALRLALQSVDAGDQLTADIRAAYAGLGRDVVVAVRSSATAEDLAHASFAGQQDSFLDVHGEASVIAAIKACWASLWTERAVVYRARAGIDPRSVKLAVIVQAMVGARAAGVMFTADPITGSRRRMVIDAAAGRGEMVVSGRHDVDHYVADRETGRIVSSHIAEAVTSIGEVAVETLVEVGGRIEAHFGAPQDVEFVFDPENRLWITQTRAITTLFPLPLRPASTPSGLRVYFSSTADEGVVRPITPMGLQAFRMAAGAAADLFWRRPPADRLVGPGFVVEAGQRSFYDVTPLIQSATARRLVRPFISVFDAHTAAIFDVLFRNPDLSPRPDSLWRIAPVALRPLWRFPFITGIARAFLAPRRTRARSANLLTEVLDQARPSPGESSRALLDKVVRLLWNGSGAIPRMALLEPLTGFIAFALAKKILGKSLGETEEQVLLSGLSNSVTVTLNLDLWELSQAIASDSQSRAALTAGRAEDLRDAFLSARLPPVLMQGLRAYLDRHGHRAVFEVDLGLPRWSEDPTHLFASLQNYLRQDSAAADPAALHARSAAAAMTTEAAVLARVGPFRRSCARMLIGRARGLWGYREQWKDDLSRIWAATRDLLGTIGGALVANGRLDAVQDIYFLDLKEIGDLLDDGGLDARALVHARRASYQAELERRQVPAVLLSDGTDASTLVRSEAAGDLAGVGASPGLARGRARVLREPVGATIEPGEILVAPSTDPGWTPLFMTAAGLVMEKGAPMCHGAVIAREFGIPAVVSVPGATDLIETGQMLEIDGASGRVTLIGRGNESVTDGSTGPGNGPEDCPP